MMIRMVIITSMLTMLLMVTGPSSRSIAEVNVNVGIGVTLPAVVIPSPPDVILVPGTYAYFVPDIDTDIFFYHGYWYRPYKKYWYRSSHYNGPWTYIVNDRVPLVLSEIPPDFRHIPPGQTRIPYGQLKKNWKQWEKEKHWDKHKSKAIGKGGKGKGKWK
jgi:hypothetical protein